MSAGDSITADGQIELQGLVMGPGTEYEVQRFEPWVAPTPRVGELPQGGQDGVIAGDELLGGRAIPLTLLLASDDAEADLDYMRSLTATWALLENDVALVWREFTDTFLVWGRPRLADPRMVPGLPVECRFLATDPLIYDVTEQSETVSFPTTSGGINPPLSFPINFGGTATSGNFTATNSGLAPVGWTAEFVGPWVNPIVENVTTGESIRLTGTVATGQTLVVDSRTHSILLNGTSRRGWLRAGAQWWKLAPGGTEVRLSGSSGSGNATLRWRSGWK